MRRRKEHDFDRLVGGGDDEDRGLPGRAQLKLLCSGQTNIARMENGVS
jgi:hypothetical protein